MAAASMLIHVTHIDDSVRGRQGPCVYFWGVTYDRSLILTMELYLESIRQTLESLPPPLNLCDLDSKQILCVLFNHRWHRATISELKLSQTGMVEVYCIDSGKTLTVPLKFIRPTMDIDGYEAENIRDCPPLASQFLLADVVAPFGLGIHTRQWSDLAMMFLKVCVEHQIWKAAPMSKYGAHQAVRLFDSNNQLLASAMILQGLGVAAQSYHEALAMSEAMEKQPSFMKPAFYSYPSMKLFPAACLTALSGNLRPNFAIATPQQDRPVSTVSPKEYSINNLPHKGRYDVVVSHISEGPYKFFVQMKSEAQILQNIRKKLNSLVPTPFQGKPLGSPCIVFSPSDELFHRGLITGMKDFGTQSCTYSVYIVDVGTQISVNLSAIYDIPDELFAPCLCAYRVSLFGVEKVSKLNGLNGIFASMVNCKLQAEIVDYEKQEINLYDESGNNICGVLCSIFSMYPNMKDIAQTSSVSSTSFCLPTEAIPISVVEMPSLSLATEENLFVIHAGEPGYFFGQFEEKRVQNSQTVNGNKDINDLTAQLKLVYSTQANSSLLYSGSESRIGHYGVIIWEEDDVYYRVRVTREMDNKVEILFIDYGNTISITRNKILSPLKCLSLFSQPPYGIHCKLEEEVTMPSLKWKHLIMDKWITVKIGSCIEGIYRVKFASYEGNAIATKILNAVTKPSVSSENVNRQITKIESPVLAAVAKVSNPIQLKDNRHIRNLENVDFSVTISNKPCKGGQISEICAKETAQHSTKLISNKENVEAEAKDLNSVGKNIETSQSTQIQKLTREPEIVSLPSPVEVTTCTSLSQPSFSDSSEKLQILNQESEQSEKPEDVTSTIESETKSEIVTDVTALPEISTPLSLNKPQITFSEQNEDLSDQQGEVVYVNDPSSFYVQLLESCALLGEVGEKLNSLYCDKSKPAIQGPNPGSACVVQYTEDNQWYRGQIVKMCDPQSATVLFVDYGNTQLCPVEQVKAIDEDFVKLPPLAVHCKLAGIVEARDWTVEEKSKFESYTVGKLLSVNFTNRDPDGKYPVRLLRKTKEGKCVINEDFGAPCFAKIPPPSVGYTSRVVSIQPINVIVSCYHNPFRFFLSPVEVTYQDQLEELDKFYSSLSPNDLLEDKPSLGLPCVARFTEDSRYYRSQILSIQNEMAEILFVDYGNQQDTPLSQLKRITPRFMEFPQMTWHCKLKGVKMVDPIGADLQKHIDACFTTNEEITALFHPATSDESNGVFEVDLSVPKIGDASRYLIEHKVLACDLLVADVELAVQDVNFAPQQVLSTNAATGYFVSPTDFWVQLDPKAVDDVMERLDKLALDPDFINKKDFVPSIGKACLAFYETDKRWYRAKVQAVKEDSSTICYIDFGNSCDVKTCDLRGLPMELAQQPGLAFKCCQDGAENFSDAASKNFGEIVLDLTHFSVKFLKVVDGVLCVRLSHGESDVGEICSLSSDLTEPLTQESIVNGVVSTSTFTQEEICVVEDKLAISEIRETQALMKREVPQDSVPVPQLDLVIEKDCKMDRMEVVVVYASSPFQFWIQIKKDQDKLEKMQDEIVKEYSKNSELLKAKAKPVVDQIYGVLHPSYGSWYRGKITEVCDDTAVVHFVDYGDSSSVPFANICVLAKHFADISAFATQCSLINQSTEWSEAACEKFNSVCTDQVCLITFEKEDNGVKIVNSLFVGDENKNIVDLLAGL